jgi:CHASE2 domain-containing sensor protein
MNSRLVRALFLGCLVAIVGIVICPFRFALDLEENTGLGLLFALRGKRPAPTDIVIVSIDKESADKLDIPDNPDKWPRSLHARLIENLVQEGAAVIAFDVHFIEPRSAEDDNLFAEAINKAKNVVLCEPLKAKELPTADNGKAHAGIHNIVKIVKPLAIFASAAAATAPFVLPRIPFKVNQYWRFQTDAGDSPTIPTVAYQLFASPVYGEFIQLLEKTSPNQISKLPRASNKVINTGGIKKLILDVREVFESEPLLAEKMLAELKSAEPQSRDEQRGRLLRSLIKMYGGTANQFINYYGPPRTVATIPYYQALQIRQGKIEDRQVDLQGKAVFVGLSEIILADRKDSFYTVFSQSNGIFISGVEIAATAFSNIAEDTPVKPLSLRFYVLVIIVWGILVGVVCRISTLKFGAMGAVGLCILYLASAVLLFKAEDVWIPVVVPLLFQTPLAFLGAVATEHLWLIKEALIKVRMADDLSVARDVQMSMLPATCPEVAGFQIAASSTPAREVSGDFFDFIEIGENKLGFVIADVTGKSVSGALVMTASKSVFRLLSEGELTVGEIMIRANRQIKKDITKAKGMFVALLYAVLNIENRTISLCSAGQTQPIHLAAKSGEAILVETEGDAFPLGILDDADYQETQLCLEPGDIVVFYTDGVVEAMNKANQMYGFDRFLSVIKENRELGADDFLAKMIADVAGFVGTAEQHDDLTIVVIKVEEFS